MSCDKPKRSKPSKMTPECERELLACIRAGMPVARACELLEIHETTLLKHRRQHPEFSALYQKALKARERLLLKAIASGSKQWQARAWLLSKLKPDVYGRKVDEAPIAYVPVRIETPVVERDTDRAGQTPAGEGTPASTPAGEDPAGAGED